MRLIEMPRPLTAWISVIAKISAIVNGVFTIPDWSSEPVAAPVCDSQRCFYDPRLEQRPVRPGQIVVPLFAGNFAVDTPSDSLGGEAGNRVRDLPLVELGDSLLQLRIVQGIRIRILEMDEDPARGLVSANSVQESSEVRHMMQQIG